MKIKCPTGEQRTIDECKNCLRHCVPKPIRYALLHGRKEKDHKNEKAQYGVSSLVGDCLRQSYYRITEEEVFDLEKLWAFSRGHAIHEFITKTLERKEKEIFVKKEFPAFNIVGYVDAIHNDVIYEFKTTPKIPDKPQNNHILQGQGYFSLLPPEWQKQIRKIILIYLDMQKIKAFEVPKQDITTFLESKAAQLTLALRNKTPLRQEVSWLCKYCDYYEKCFEGQTKLM